MKKRVLRIYSKSSFRKILAKHNIPVCVLSFQNHYTNDRFNRVVVSKTIGNQIDMGVLVSDGEREVLTTEKTIKGSVSTEVVKCPKVVIASNHRRYRGASSGTNRVLRVFLFAGSTPEMLDEYLMKALI